MRFHHLSESPTRVRRHDSERVVLQELLAVGLHTEQDLRDIPSHGVDQFQNLGS